MWGCPKLSQSFKEGQTGNCATVLLKRTNFEIKKKYSSDQCLCFRYTVCKICHKWLHCQVFVRPDRKSCGQVFFCRWTISYYISPNRCLNQTCFVLEHEQCIQFVPRKQQFSVWKIGIFYLERFPIKMGPYVRLRCINQSTIRREISIQRMKAMSFAK